jgi:cell division septum initiation protein DivIVA
MFGRVFDTTEVDKYADWVIAEVQRTLPPGFDPNMKNVAERAESLNQRIAKQTETFTRSTSLNLFKKARLAARIRDGMNAHGYPEPFVKALSFDLLNRIRAATKAKA